MAKIKKPKGKPQPEKEKKISTRTVGGRPDDRNPPPKPAANKRAK